MNGKYSSKQHIMYSTKQMWTFQNSNIVAYYERVEYSKSCTTYDEISLFCVYEVQNSWLGSQDGLLKFCIATRALVHCMGDLVHCMDHQRLVEEQIKHN